MTASAFRNFPAGFRPDRPERIQSSLTDTDDSTAKTVAAMAAHIKVAQTDPRFLAVAHNLTRSRELSEIVSAVFLFCKAAIKFKLDEQSVWDLYGERDAVDFLIEPRAMVRMMPNMYGDCDEFTMFSLACLTALGVPCEIVTVACDRTRPGAWSHVYGQVVLPDGRRMALDCSPAGKCPGWEVPDYDVQRKQAWDLSGNMVDAPAASKDLRLHAYIPRPRSRRGMGDQLGSGEGGIETTGGIFDSGGGSTTVLDPSLIGFQQGVTSPGTTVGSGSSFNWNALVGNLANIGTRLGTIALTPSGGYVQTGPNGQTIVSNTGLPANLTSFGTGSGGSIFLWLGVGLVVLLIVGGSHK